MSGCWSDWMWMSGCWSDWMIYCDGSTIGWLFCVAQVSSANSATAAASQPFMDLFGPPIKTTVDSPKKSKHKVQEEGWGV